MLPEDNNSLSLKVFKMTICWGDEILVDGKILSFLSSVGFLCLFLLSTHLYNTLQRQFLIMIIIYTMLS